jgi:hypothetical protein
VRAPLWGQAGEGSSPARPAAPDARPATPDADFRGKYLVLSFKSDLETAAYLEQASLRRLGRHEFLVGVSVDLGDEYDWSVGRRMWIPVDDIAMIVEFETLEELQDSLSDPGLIPSDLLPRA